MVIQAPLAFRGQNRRHGGDERTLDVGVAAGYPFGQSMCLTKIRGANKSSFWVPIFTMFNMFTMVLQALMALAAGFRRTFAALFWNGHTFCRCRCLTIEQLEDRYAMSIGEQLLEIAPNWPSPFVTVSGSADDFWKSLGWGSSEKGVALTIDADIAEEGKRYTFSAHQLNSTLIVTGTMSVDSQVKRFDLDLFYQVYAYVPTALALSLPISSNGYTTHKNEFIDVRGLALRAVGVNEIAFDTESPPDSRLTAKFSLGYPYAQAGQWHYQFNEAATLRSAFEVDFSGSSVTVVRNEPRRNGWDLSGDSLLKNYPNVRFDNFAVDQQRYRLKESRSDGSGSPSVVSAKSTIDLFVSEYRSGPAAQILGQDFYLVDPNKDDTLLRAGSIGIWEVLDAKEEIVAWGKGDTFRVPSETLGPGAFTVGFYKITAGLSGLEWSTDRVSIFVEELIDSGDQGPGPGPKGDETGDPGGNPEPGTQEPGGSGPDPNDDSDDLIEDIGGDLGEALGDLITDVTNWVKDNPSETADAGLDFVPLLGDLKSLLEAIRGRGLVSGDDLGTLDRLISGISALPGITPGITKGIANIADKLAGGTKGLKHGDDFVEVTTDAAKAGDDAADATKNAGPGSDADRRDRAAGDGPDGDQQANPDGNKPGETVTDDGCFVASTPVHISVVASPALVVEAATVDWSAITVGTGVIGSGVAGYQLMRKVGPRRRQAVIDALFGDGFDIDEDDLSSELAQRKLARQGSATVSAAPVV